VPGAGEVRRNHGFLTVAQTCPKCRGAGQINRSPCRECRGEGRRRAERLLNVKIPAGSRTACSFASAAKAPAASGAARQAISTSSCASRARDLHP
jgi:DnaJ-class molecular chaperone